MLFLFNRMGRPRGKSLMTTRRPLSNCGGQKFLEFCPHNFNQTDYSNLKETSSWTARSQQSL